MMELTEVEFRVVVTESSESVPPFPGIFTLREVSQFLNLNHMIAWICIYLFWKFVIILFQVSCCQSWWHERNLYPKLYVICNNTQEVILTHNTTFYADGHMLNPISTRHKQTNMYPLYYSQLIDTTFLIWTTCKLHSITHTKQAKHLNQIHR